MRVVHDRHRIARRGWRANKALAPDNVTVAPSRFGPVSQRTLNRMLTTRRNKKMKITLPEVKF